MKYVPVFASLFCCYLVSADVTAQTSRDQTKPNQHVYIDDDDQRSLADLKFDVETANQQNLRITVSALGPHVEPIAGFRGVSGGNRYTAEELGLILDGYNKASIVTQFDDGRTTIGRILEGKFGTLPERRLLPNGRIDFLARTALEYPLELVVDPKTKSSGRRTTMVVIGGQARLRCRYSIVNGQVQDLEVQSLGGDKFLANSTASVRMVSGKFILTAADEDVPEFAPVTDADWDQRDIEGKWVLLIHGITNSPEKIEDWAGFLKRKNENTLLEWMAIYIPDAFKSYGVGNALITADAPQWIRVAAWHNNGPANFGHGMQQATNFLMHSKPGLVEHWLQDHQAGLDNWETSLKKVYEALQKDKVKPQESAKYLPPLKPENVFRLLSSTKTIVDFGDRTQAEEGVLYRHQVIRTINAVPVSGRRGDDVLKAVRELTWHKDEGIRIAALLAHTYLLPKSAGTEQFEDFVTMADDSSESGKVREAALMAFSYHRHPGVILKLHQVAADPQHGAWKAAVSRIGDIGRSWSLPLLKEVMDADLSAEQSDVMADALDRLKTRLNNSRKAKPNAYDTANGIVLAVLADKVDDPNAEAIQQWVVNRVAAMEGKQLKKLTHQMGFERLPKIWLPCSEQQFVHDYDTFRSGL